MIVLYVILGLLGYTLVASLVSGIYRNVIKNGEDDALWTGALWPVTLPFILLWAVTIPFIYAIKWLSGKISDFIQKYILKSKDNDPED